MMLKKQISLLLIVCIVCGFGTLGVFADDTIDEASVYFHDSLAVSGDGEGDPGTPYTKIPQQTETAPDGTVRPKSATVRSFDGTNRDGTLEVTDGIYTNIIENSSKYNGMASDPVSEDPARSRYSTRRITLAPDIAGTEYEEAAELLGALGIMVGDAEDGAFRPSDSIIRSEMAKVAVYSVGLEDVAKSSASSVKFPDVPADHWAAGVIHTADLQGMIVGDDIGTYRPDDPVLLQEAVTIIVRALGYEPAAIERGGYPTGYMYVASSNQLLRGLHGTATEAATRGDIAQLVFNALTVNLMEQVGYGTNTAYEVVDKTLLYDRLNVEKGYGQINATEETALSEAGAIDRGKIQIGEKTYLEGDTLAKQQLGYNVLYYARMDKKTDEKTLIHVRVQQNKNKAVTVHADDLVSVKTNDDGSRSIEYWPTDDDTRMKAAEIPQEAVYIYNGKYKLGVTEEELKPTAGYVTLLDADENGKYEIVFVNHSKNLVVDTVSSVTGRVTDKYVNGSLTFDKNQDTVLYSLIKNGTEIEVDALKEWNVISYTISDDKLLIKGYVSDASRSGMITEATEEGYRIGSSAELYKKADSYPSEIALRDRGTFYFDIEDKIAAVDENAVSNDEQAAAKKYAYLVGAAMNDGFDTTAQLKLFTAAGETKIVDTTAKLRLNNRYAQEAKNVVEALGGQSGFTPQMIVYETNQSGAVNAIELATDKTDSGTPNPHVFTKNINQSDMVYKTASSKLGQVGITDQTVIFDIPSNAGLDTDKYSVRTKATLTNDSAYDAIIYDLQENYEAKVVVITDSDGITAPEAPILVVDHISATQNENGEDTDRVYGLQGGKEVDLLAADKTVLLKDKDSENTLSKGDVIQYRTNPRGEINGITVLFDSSAKDTEFVTEVTEDMTAVYGKVTKKFSGSVNMTVNGKVYNFATDQATVYLYDSNRSKTDIRVVSPADIEIYETGNEARLFLKIYNDVVQEMMIVR